MGYRISILLSFCLIVTVVGCTLQANTEQEKQSNINGLSYAAANVLIDSTDIVAMKGIGANWVALMPYGFIRQEENKLVYNSDRQWVSETTEGITKDIQLAHKAGLKVMLKPHVWINHGAYTGDFDLEKEDDWEVFETSFQNYVLEFARVAETEQVELFCIGTEWRKFINKRPKFWHQVITETKKVYSGQLTYAANWDEYSEIPFWNQLDFIGVNGYFPLTEKINPSLEELELAWQPISKHLSEVSLRFQKPILFTEYGYRSVEGTTIKPWESYSKGKASMTEQQIALQALYKSNWSKPWFAGGFLWKWFSGHSKRGGIMNSDYTPQNKPVAVIIRDQYGASH